MKFKTVQTILTAAKDNQQRVVIKTHNDSDTFDFSKGYNVEDDIIEYDSDTDVISVFGNSRNIYIESENIECIKVYK